jgi:hypothetical protein
VYCVSFDLASQVSWRTAGGTLPAGTVKHAGGPDAELGAAPRVDAIADGDDGIEVVVPDSPPHLPATLRLNYREILGSCCLLQLALAEDVLQMESDVIGRSVEDLREVSLGEPDRLALQPDVDPDPAAGGLVDDEIAARGRGCGAVHRSASLSPARSLRGSPGTHRD